MSSISSLSRAMSALRANQTGLTTTAHNLANVNTQGYVKQQVLMNDTSYQTIGRNSTGIMQLGTGTDVQVIRQVRDQFLDAAFREENSRYGFYSAQSTTVDEVESILGETEGEAFSKIMNGLWESLSELSKHPEGLETRGSLVQNAVLFIEKANLISQQLQEYQVNMNTEVMNKVDRINDIGHEIKRLNELISSNEVGGAHANDYRDQRNQLLDELSYMVDVDYKEDARGNVQVSVERVPFVTTTDVNEMGVIQAENKSAMVDPYWPNMGDPTATPPIYRKVYNFSNPTGPQYDNNKGELKGLIMSRGSRAANYTDLQDATVFNDEVKKSAIMTVQAQFDNLVHGVVTMINDVVSPNTAGALDLANAPYGLNGTQGYELFSRKYVDRYDGSGNYNVEDPTNDVSLYSAGNIEVNKDILLDYNKIALSKTLGDDGDSSVVESILDKWQKPFSVLDPSSSGELDYVDYYNNFVANVGNLGSVAGSEMSNQHTLITQIDNQRSSVMGVSSDEELGNMITFQHAYNAAARVVSTINDMIGRVIEQTGVVGR